MESLEKTVDEKLNLGPVKARLNDLQKEVQDEFSLNPDAFVAVRFVPISLFGDQLPQEVKSCRLSVMRAGTAYKRERHPNADQYVRSLDGSGEIRVLEGENWRIDRLGPSEELMWHCVPAGTWHQPVPSEQSHWYVLAFHTADQVFDEYME